MSCLLPPASGKNGQQGGEDKERDGPVRSGSQDGPPHDGYASFITIALPLLPLVLTLNGGKHHRRW